LWRQATRKTKRVIFVSIGNNTPITFQAREEVTSFVNEDLRSLHISSHDTKETKYKNIFSSINRMVKVSLGGTTSRNEKGIKNGKIIFLTFYFKCFHNYKLFFSHFYQLHALIYGLKFILECSFEKFKKLYFQLKWFLHKLIALILEIHN